MLIRRGERQRPLAPTAPRRRPVQAVITNQVEVSPPQVAPRPTSALWPTDQHPLTDERANSALLNYEQETKGGFDRIVPVLQKLSAMQREPDFVPRAQRLAKDELGYELPQLILSNAWVSQLDMRSLFAW